VKTALRLDRFVKCAAKINILRILLGETTNKRRSQDLTKALNIEYRFNVWVFILKYRTEFDVFTGIYSKNTYIQELRNMQRVHLNDIYVRTNSYCLLSVHYSSALNFLLCYCP
jgi:hypothetical protein